MVFQVIAGMHGGILAAAAAYQAGINRLHLVGLTSWHSLTVKPLLVPKLALRWQTSLKDILTSFERGLGDEPRLSHWSREQYQVWRYKWVLQHTDQGEMLAVAGRFLRILDKSYFAGCPGLQFGIEDPQTVSRLVANAIYILGAPRVAQMTIVVADGRRIPAVNFLNLVAKDEEFAEAYGRCLIPFFRWYLARSA